jgi:hypothetical protein
VSVKPARQTAKFRKQLDRIFLNDDSQTKILELFPSRCILSPEKLVPQQAATLNSIIFNEDIG